MGEIFYAFTNFFRFIYYQQLEQALTQSEANDRIYHCLFTFKRNAHVDSLPALAFFIRLHRYSSHRACTSASPLHLKSSSHYTGSCVFNVFLERINSLRSQQNPCNRQRSRHCTFLCLKWSSVWYRSRDRKRVEIDPKNFRLATPSGRTLHRKWACPGPTRNLTKTHLWAKLQAEIMGVAMVTSHTPSSITPSNGVHDRYSDLRSASTASSLLRYP